MQVFTDCLCCRWIAGFLDVRASSIEVNRRTTTSAREQVERTERVSVLSQLVGRLESKIETNSSSKMVIMSTATMSRTVNVTITSDLLCPWCWVGLRKLQEASQLSNVQTVITWRPFLLRPNIPEHGMPKGGTPADRVGHHLKQAGESVGINFTGLCDRTPNTVLFHAAMKMLQQECNHEIATSFQEAVFMGYFTLGVYPDQDALLAAAKKVGNNNVLDKVSKLFQDTDRLSLLRKQVVLEAAEASRQGVTGVPSFSFGDEDEPAFSGAQPTEVFVRYLNKYAKQQQEE